MGAAARCVDVPIGSPIRRENNGLLAAKNCKHLGRPSRRLLVNPDRPEAWFVKWCHVSGRTICLSESPSRGERVDG